MERAEQYYLQFAAAFVRGRIPELVCKFVPNAVGKSLEQLSSDELLALIELGHAQGLKLHKFKRTMGLSRVERVLGMLRGIQPESLLDIGSGRGVFLWPCLNEFTATAITSIDVKPHRVEDINAVRAGGIAQARALEMSATEMTFSDREFDVATFLEVLEHIPDAQRALNEALRVARRFVIVSVPSKADNNPEHIHLFTRPQLESMFQMAGRFRCALITYTITRSSSQGCGHEYANL